MLVHWLIGECLQKVVSFLLYSTNAFKNADPFAASCRVVVAVVVFGGVGVGVGCGGAHKERSGQLLFATFASLQCKSEMKLTEVISGSRLM